MNDECAIEGCTRKPHSRGLCGPHYCRAWSRAELSDVALPSRYFKRDSSDADTMRQMKAAGHTYEQIARRFGIRRQRVQQIVGPRRDEREAAMRRTRGHCAVCGAADEHMTMHHEDYETGALLVLCRCCHGKLHARATRLTGTGEDSRQLEEAVA